MKCTVPMCHKEAPYFMTWVKGGVKHEGFFCATHDKLIGRKHLIEAGMTLQEAIEFESDKEGEC